MPKFAGALCAVVSLALCAMSQDREASGEWTPVNSISAMVASQPPKLQGGFCCDDDQWLLYSWKFDALSQGARTHLLAKYGYSQPGSAFLQARKPRADRSQAAPQTPAPPPAPGANIKVTSDLLDVGRRLQSETTIAVAGDTVLVGYNDGDTRSDGVSYSRDGGATWSRGRLPFFPGVIGNSGDPVLGVGPNNRFYHAYLAATGVGFLAIAVARSDDGGATWQGPINASAAAVGSAGGNDKPWMAVDNVTGSTYRGNVYVAWTRFSTQDAIILTRSTDGGLTFSNPAMVTQLAPSEQTFQGVQGSHIAIGPAGEVCVSWYDSRFNGIRFSKSLDGGATFSSPVTAVANVGAFFGVYLPGQFDMPAFPQIAVDLGSGAARGTLYLTTNIRTSSGTMDVVLTRSTDGGANWSAAARVNNDSTNTDQFMPAIAVAGNGNVGVNFYDRRNDPDNNVLTDVYLAISSDGGFTFPIQQRVTTANWPTLPTPLGYRTGYHGDYNQMVASGSNFYLSWGDDRSGLDPDVYMAVVPVTGNVPDSLLTAARPAADVLAGGSAAFTFNTPGASGVALTAKASGPGITFQIAGNTVTAVAAATAAAGTYTIIVTGTNAGVQRSTVVRLTVHNAALPRVPVVMNLNSDPVYLVHAAADAAGNIHMVSLKEIENRIPKRLSYARIPAGTSVPSAAVTVLRADASYGADQSFLEPQVAADASGKIYVVWRRNDRNGAHILLSTSTNGQTFSAPFDVSSIRLPQAAIQPRVAVSKTGTVFVAYIQSQTNVAADVLLVRSTDGGATFSAAVNVSRYNSVLPIALQTTSPPVLALDGDGNPHLVWVAANLGRTDVYYSRSTDGGTTFGPVVSASRSLDTQITIRHAALAVDAQKRVYVAWNSANLRTGQGDCFMAVSNDGSVFGNSVNLSEATFFTGALTDWPSLVVDGNGVVTAAWRQWIADPLRGNDTQRDIFYARCTSGGGGGTGANCSKPINASSSLGDTYLAAGSTALQPTPMAIDASGKVYLFWDDNTSGSTQMMMLVLP